MNSTQTEEDIFLTALEIDPPQARAAYLDQACGQDAALRQRVERLLRRHDQSQGVLDAPPPGFANTTELPTGIERPEVIGPYKLLEQIGEGGFGVVFMAEQERPVRRRVALKIIKPGMDTREVIARFEAERQALALMDHPNIAKIFDAGMVGPVSRTGPDALPEEANEGPARQAGSTGRPYFVMELVKGIPITEYCDQCDLTTRERLELFVTVCGAIQHAHQKGVMHRDIKPTNVMVTMQDGRPAPKIIDFGVAKALNQRLTEHTLATGYGQMIGTPLYMSPEQAELSPLGADTRSDIYSLGVLLYELLAGATPFGKDRLHAASYEELRRILREEDPPRPSARLSTLAADLATTVAEHHRTDPRRHLQAVRGELDWIVMKCLEKDRNRRYETASSLARDVERYLHDEPVVACPPSAAYRFSKFARRHRMALAAGAIVVAALVAGTVVSTWQAIRATRAEALAANRLEAENQARQEALAERNQAQRRLFDARFAQAKASRASGQMGQRFETLDALAEAAQLARRLGLGDQRLLALRNAAIAGMTGVDVRIERHWDGVEAQAFDHALEHYAQVVGDGNIAIRRVRDDEVTNLFPAVADSIEALCLSSQGRYLAVEHRSEASTPIVDVWDVRRRERLATIQDASNPRFSADEASLAVGHLDGWIDVYEMPTGLRRQRLGPILAPAMFQFDPTGRFLAAHRWILRGTAPSTEDMRTTIWDLTTGSLVRALDHPLDVKGIRALAWHPEGRLFAVASGVRIFVWDAASWTQRAILEGHQSEPWSVAFHPAGDVVASTSGDGTIRLWDPWGSQQLLSANIHGERLEFKAGDFAIVSGRRPSRGALLHIASGRECRTLPAHEGIGKGPWTLSYSRDGRLLASGSGDGVRFWEAATGRELAHIPSERSDFAARQSDRANTSSALFHPNGRELITSGARAAVSRWPIARAANATIRIGPPQTLAENDQFGRLALSGDGRWLAAISGRYVKQPRPTLIDLTGEQSHRALEVHANAMEIAISPDGRWLATGTFDGSGVKIWDLDTRQVTSDLPVESSSSVRFTPDGKWLVTGEKGKYRFWEVGKWRAGLSIERPSRVLTGWIAFAPDGKLAAMAHTQRLIKLVDPTSGREIASLPAPKRDLITQLCFSPDGSQLAVATENSMIQLWDLRLIREQLREMDLDWDLPPYPPAPHRDSTQPLTVELDFTDDKTILRKHPDQNNDHQRKRPATDPPDD